MYYTIRQPYSTISFYDLTDLQKSLRIPIIGVFVERRSFPDNFKFHNRMDSFHSFSLPEGISMTCDKIQTACHSEVKGGN